MRTGLLFGLIALGVAAAAPSPAAAAEPAVRVTPVSSDPEFCRTGRGHPVHGRRWCADRGWAVGPTARVGRLGGRRAVCRPIRGTRRSECRTAPVRRGYVAPRSPWVDVRWNVRLRTGRDYAWDRRLNERELAQAVGGQTFDRLRDHAWRMGARGRLRGEWYDLDRAGGVLEVRAGGRMIAELHDYGYDRRVDRVLLRRR